jgi:hypothetical protein
MTSKCLSQKVNIKDFKKGGISNTMDENDMLWNGSE